MGPTEHNILSVHNNTTLMQLPSSLWTQMAFTMVLHGQGECACKSIHRYKDGT